jgi:hypothetical protein
VLRGIKIYRNCCPWEQSLDPTSTASWWMFDFLLSSSHHHHLCPRRPNSLPTVDVQQHRAPPLSRGMWAGSILLGVVEGIREGGNQGGPRKWEAHVLHHETRHDFGHASLSLFLSSPAPPLTTWPPSIPNVMTIPAQGPMTMSRNPTRKSRTPRRQWQPNAEL